MSSYNYQGRSQNRSFFFEFMKCVIPYKSNGGVELKYCLRGIEKFVKDPEVIIIGAAPEWLQNATTIFFPDGKQLKFKEWNIFRKICQVKDDFIFFNDDHFLLQPFREDTYHFTGNLTERMKKYGSNEYWKTIQNTINVIGGNADNYFRHAPIFIKREILEKIKELNWNAWFGYCVKSLYCHFAGIKGTEYPDLKITSPQTLTHIQSLTKDRQYFSTGNYVMNKDMIAFLEQTYPTKSQFEK